MLVTDYSSVMFDFAVTGRPIVLFCFDLERYRDVLRGFYFDFEAEAPGPLVVDEEALLDVLSRPAEAAAEHADAYRRFTARFCPLDDGGASARVVDAVLTS